MGGHKLPTPDQPSPGPATHAPISFLDRERQTVRAQFSVQTLTPEERQTEEDAYWAQHDPDVQAAYSGEFVVPFQRRIVAHGRRAADVLAEAARVTGRKAQSLPLVGIVDPLLDLPH
jgi:hypothetical protein